MRPCYLIFAAVLVLTTNDAAARDYKIGAVEILHPWARATPKGAKVAGGYMKIINTATAPDRLVGGTASIAGRFEIHEMAMDAGVMKMRQVRNGLEIKPGATVELKPGSSFHVMFQDLLRPLVKGESVKGTLTFEKAGTIEIEYQVEAIGAHPATHTGAQ